MRVLLDVHVIGGPPQGTSTVWLNLLPNLPRRHTYVLASFDPEATRRLFPGDRFEHVPFPVHQPHLRIQGALPWMARRERCDAVHVNYYGPLVGAPGLVVTMHDTIYLDFPEFAPLARRVAFRTLARLTARTAKRVVAVSEYSRRGIERHFGVPAERVAVVPPGVGDAWHAPDLAAIDRAWERIAPRLPERYLLAVGRWDPRKGFLESARITAALAREGLVDGLVVVGPDDFGGEALRATLAREGLDRLVTPLRDLDLHTLQAVYRGGAAQLFLSRAEGFGIPPLEAMAMGTPVVAADRTAIPEVCGDGAVLVDPDDLEAATDAVRRVLTDATHRAQLVARGRRRVATFTTAGAAEAMARVYEAAAED